MFQRYPHLEKLGNIEVEGIEFGDYNRKHFEFSAVSVDTEEE